MTKHVYKVCNFTYTQRKEERAATVYSVFIEKTRVWRLSFITPDQRHGLCLAI